MSGWNFERTRFYWGDGTYTTRKQVVEAHWVQLILPESRMFGLPRYPVTEEEKCARDVPRMGGRGGGV